jgi:hypothetical protein
MGGLGSGRRRWRLGVEECRALEVGELCDAGRRQRQPRGEVRWCPLSGGAPRARLTYLISERDRAGAAQLLLAYRYWPGGSGPFFDDQVELEGGAGRRTYARCPAFAELDALPKRTRRRPRRAYVARPPRELASHLEEELPLGDEELRLWCLRLRAAGLSYRQIAALTESSKSSVARICAAGREGIDARALVHERLERASAGPALPESDDPGAVATYLKAFHRHALRRGLYRFAATDPEVRLLVPEDIELAP